MTFVHGTALSKAIRDALAGAQRDAAVAFWGANAMKRLGINDPRGMRIACDLQSGACNPKAITELRDAGAEIYDVPGLHAKVYLGAASMVVCSANASANGLGEEDEEVNVGFEAGLTCTDQDIVDEARQWFNLLIDKLTLIDDDDIKRCKEAWRKRRDNRPHRKSPHDFLAALQADDPTLRDRGYRVAIYSYTELDPKVDHKFKNSGYAPSGYDGTGNIPYFWDCRDWHFVEGELILSTHVDDGHVDCEGVWRVDKNLNDGELVPLTFVKRPSGLKFGGQQRKTMAKAVKQALKLGRLHVDALPIDLKTFRDAIRS